MALNAEQESKDTEINSFGTDAETVEKSSTAEVKEEVKPKKSDKPAKAKAEEKPKKQYNEIEGLKGAVRFLAERVMSEPDYQDFMRTFDQLFKGK